MKRTTYILTLLLLCQPFVTTKGVGSPRGAAVIGGDEYVYFKLMTTGLKHIYFSTLVFIPFEKKFSDESVKNRLSAKKRFANAVIRDYDEFTTAERVLTWA